MRHTRAVALAVLTCLSAVTASAGPSPHMRLDFGMLGLAHGQTARLNVVNRAAASAGDRTCAVVLSFLGADGSVVALRDQTQASVTVRPEPGQSAFLDLPASLIPGDVNGRDDTTDVPAVQRSQIRASVQTSRACLGAIDDPNIMPSLEVFDDATGRASTVLDGSSRVFIKEVDPKPTP